MGQMLNTPACPLKGPADMGRVAGCCGRRQAYAQPLTSFRTSPQALRRGGRGGTGRKDRWKQHTYIPEVIQEDKTKVSPPGLFLWLTDFLEAGCLRPENVAGVLGGGAPGQGEGSAPEESPGGAEGRPVARLLGPVSSHCPQGSGPNPEISQKVRQSAQERGRFKKKKKA